MIVDLGVLYNRVSYESRLVLKATNIMVWCLVYMASFPLKPSFSAPGPGSSHVEELEELGERGGEEESSTDDECVSLLAHGSRGLGST